MLGPDAVVPKQPCLFLREHDDAAAPNREMLEHESPRLDFHHGNPEDGTPQQTNPLPGAD